MSRYPRSPFTAYCSAFLVLRYQENPVCKIPKNTDIYPDSCSNSAYKHLLKVNLPSLFSSLASEDWKQIHYRVDPDPLPWNPICHIECY